MNNMDGYINQICFCIFVPHKGWSSGYIHVLLDETMYSVSHGCQTYNVEVSLHAINDSAGVICAPCLTHGDVTVQSDSSLSLSLSAELLYTSVGLFASGNIWLHWFEIKVSGWSKQTNKHTHVHAQSSHYFRACSVTIQTKFKMQAFISMKYLCGLVLCVRV